MVLHDAHHLLVALAVREPPQRPGDPVELPVPGDAGLEPALDLPGVAREDLGGAGAVVEPHERLRDDEPALREPMALGRERNGRLEAGDMVVGEIADDRQPEVLRLVEG